jgi:hypothetical protein
MELIEIELTLQCRVEQEASRTHKQIANKRHQEDCIMSMLQAIPYPFESKVHK